MLRKLFSPRILLVLIALISLGALGFGVLYLQNVVGLDPCSMCIVQRYALIAVMVFCLLAAALGSRVWRSIWGLLALLSAGFGAFTAARQSWLQWYPPQTSSCGRDFYSTIEAFPLSRAIPMIFRGDGDCTHVDWKFLGGSIANWSFVWLGMAIVLILIALFRHSHR